MVNHIFFSCHVDRQIWALSHFPLPQNGFDEDPIYVNIHYLFQVGKNIKVPLEVRRLFIPWVLWFTMERKIETSFSLKGKHLMEEKIALQRSGKKRMCGVFLDQQEKS